ncbi:hypothetical protein AB0957_29595 [Streptomyces zhihengii]|uniref:hypothetical protein n=1 Tax=Streptomyces zhihengii TaxID=1818004 RepID=UPI0034547B71
MSESQRYLEELNYLVDYARMSPVYFFLVRDSAECLAGDSAREPEIREETLRLISGMLDQGIVVGDMGSAEGEDLLPWGISKEETLRRVADEMRRLEDPRRFIGICWFGTAG